MITYDTKYKNTIRRPYQIKEKILNNNNKTIRTWNRTRKKKLLDGTK